MLYQAYCPPYLFSIFCHGFGSDSETDCSRFLPAVILTEADESVHILREEFIFVKDDVKVPVQRMVEPELLYSSLFNLFLYKKIGEHCNSETFGYCPDDRLCAGAFLR